MYVINFWIDDIVIVELEYNQYRSLSQYKSRIKGEKVYVINFWIDDTVIVQLEYN